MWVRLLLREENYSQPGNKKAISKGVKKSLTTSKRVGTAPAVRSEFLVAEGPSTLATASST